MPIHAEVLPAPPFLPATAGSLLAAAYTPPETQLRGGVRYALDSTPVTGWHGWMPGCTPVDAGDLKTPNPGVISTARAFTISVADGPATLFSRRPDELGDRVAGLADAVTSPAIASEFWAGAIATAASLPIATAANGWDGEPRLKATAAIDLNSGGALSPARAVGVLEEWALARIGTGLGCIHVPPRAVSSLNGPLALRRVGDLLLTALDTRVVADAGYPGTSPAGAAAAAGEAWLYATARPVIYRTPLTVVNDPQLTVNRSINQATATAWRTALILLPHPEIAAVRVTL